MDSYTVATNQEQDFQTLNLIRKSAICFTVVCLSVGLGYFYARKTTPTKIEIQERIVERVIEVEKKTAQVTTKKVVSKPDSTIVVKSGRMMWRRKER